MLWLSEALKYQLGKGNVAELKAQVYHGLLQTQKNALAGHFLTTNDSRPEIRNHNIEHLQENILVQPVAC